MVPTGTLPLTVALSQSGMKANVKYCYWLSKSASHTVSASAGTNFPLLFGTAKILQRGL